MFLKSAQVTFHSHIPTLGGALSFLGCLHLAVDGVSLRVQHPQGSVTWLMNRGCRRSNHSDREQVVVRCQCRIRTCSTDRSPSTIPR